MQDTFLWHVFAIAAKGPKRPHMEFSPNDETVSQRPFLELFRPHSGVRAIRLPGNPGERGLEVVSGVAENGTVMVLSPPLLAVNSVPSASSTACSRNTCHRCFEGHDPAFLQPCNDCNTVLFCLSECAQGSQWEHHQLECMAANRLKKAFLNEAISPHAWLALKAHFLLASDSRFNLAVASMAAHVSHFRTQPNYQWVRKCAAFISAATDISDVAHFEFLLCVVVVNSNIMLNAEGEAVGAAVDPDFALINHLCVPNTVVRPLSSRVLSLVAAEPLSPHTEITTNYCYTSFPRELRRRWLSQQFNFVCRCRLCCEKHDIFLAYDCPGCEKIICSTLIRGALDEDFGALVFAHPDPLVCLCGRPVLAGPFSRARTLHKALFGVFYLCKFDSDAHKEMLKSGCVDELLERMATVDVFALSEASLVEVSSDFDPKRAWGENRALLMELTLQMLEAGFIPAYIFPVNIVIPYLCESYKLSAPAGILLSPQDALHNLGLSVRLRFLVDIPSDLTRSKLLRVSHYFECTVAIMALVDSIFHPRRGRSPLQEKDVELYANFAFKLAFFFCCQTMELLGKVNDIKGTSFEELETIKRCLRYIDSKGWLPERTETWFREGIFTNGSVKKELAALFEVAGVPVKEEEDSFVMAAADRNQFALFFPFDKLTHIWG